MKIYVVKAHLSKTAARQAPIEESTTCLFAFETLEQAEEFIQGEEMLYANRGCEDVGLTSSLETYKTLSIEEVDYIPSGVEMLKRINSKKQAGECLQCCGMPS